MAGNDVYEISVRSVELSEGEDGSGDIGVAYRGRAGERTTVESFVSTDFRDIFDCCQRISRQMMMSEFRPNTGVNFEFDMVDDKGISIWHTAPSNFLKIPLRMNMDWTCNHLRSNFKSYTTLGVIELPEELQLCAGRMPAQKLAELLMNSMVSGLEFIGFMFLQRERMGAAHQTE